MNSDILPFLKEAGLQSWKALMDEFGSYEAERLAMLGRTNIMIHLRTEHNWTLERIAQLFGLSRERIRQLTPPGIWAQREPRSLTDEEIETALKKASRTQDAWCDKSGSLSITWIANELGLTPEQFRETYEGRFANLHFKVQTLLKYGLHLDTEEDIKLWYQEHYWSFHRGFKELANIISRETGVYISTMPVWRYFTKELRLPIREKGTYERFYDAS